MFQTLNLSIKQLEKLVKTIWLLGDADDILYMMAIYYYSLRANFICLFKFQSQ